MEKIRGKTLKEWKEYSKKDNDIPIRTEKYITVLEERIEQLLIQRVGSTCCGCDKCDNGKIWDDVGYSWTSCVCNK